MIDWKFAATRRRALAGVAAVSLLAGVLGTTSGSAAGGAEFGPSNPVTELNSGAADGCPIESPDGRSIFFASTRNPLPLGVGNDIWVARRSNKREPWGTPARLTAPVNSLFNDFCPTPLHGKRLLFVSERPGGCHTEFGDMYLTRLHPAHVPDDPQHLGCVSDGSGPNFNGPEFSPSLVTTDEGTWLFFSSTGYHGNMDLYVSEQQADGSFGPPARIDELSTSADDRMPNVSPNGLEMVFVSDRTDLTGHQGAHDVYISRREHVSDRWGPPTNLGPDVNSTTGESRPSLSADGDRLYFGRNGDIWMSTRAQGG